MISILVVYKTLNGGPRIIVFFLWYGYESSLLPSSPAVASGITFPVGNDLLLPFSTVGTATLTIITWTSMFSPETLGSPQFSAPSGHCREFQIRVTNTKGQAATLGKWSTVEKLESLCGWGFLFLILQPFVVRWSMGLDLSEVLIFQGEKKQTGLVWHFLALQTWCGLQIVAFQFWGPSPSRPWLVTWAWSCAEASDPDCTAESQGSLLVLSSPDILAQGPSSPAGQSICWGFPSPWSGGARSLGGTCVNGWECVCWGAVGAEQSRVKAVSVILWGLEFGMSSHGSNVQMKPRSPYHGCHSITCLLLNSHFERFYLGEKVFLSSVWTENTLGVYLSSIYIHDCSTRMYNISFETFFQQ